MNPIDSRQREKTLSLVRAAVALEHEAGGGERRQAFRTTRYLLAAARAVGISAAELAQGLGVRPDTVRDRAGIDGPIAAETFASIAGIPERRVHDWDLPDWNGDTTTHAASALLDALLRDGQDGATTSPAAALSSQSPH